MIADRIARGLESRAIDSSLVEPEPWMFDVFGGAKTFAGPKVNVKTSLSLIPVFAAIRILSSGVGSLPMSVYRGRGRDRREDPTAPQWELLHEQFNDEHASDVGFETLTGHVVGWGNAYAEKVKAVVNGRPIVDEIWPIYPGHVHVDRDSKGKKVFEIAGNPRSFYSDTILHIPAFGYNGLTGLSPIQQAKQAIGVGLSREEWQGSFYGAGGEPSGVLQTDARLSPEAAQKLSARWRARRKGEVAVLEEGVHYNATAVSPRDAQFVEAMQFDASQIAALFQVPPSWIGGKHGDTLTYATVEGEGLHWVKFKLRPVLVRIEKALRADPDIFPDRDLYPKFNVDALLRGDSVARATFYKTMREIGAYSVNDIREEENKPPVTGGDVYQQTPTGAAPNAAGGATPSNGG